MTEETQLLEETVDRLFAQQCAARAVDGALADGLPHEGLWQALADAELPWIGVPESAGGPGGGATEIAVLLRAAGRYAAPVPLAETIVAARLFAAAGLPVPREPVTLADPRDPLPRLVREGKGLRLSGRLARVPWASGVPTVVAVAESDEGPVLTAVATSDCRITPGRNVAREPRDEVDLNNAPAVVAVPAPVPARSVRGRGALARALQMTGALQRALELTVRYAEEREQFGRPIGRFQAVQHQVAALAAEAAAARAATDAAVRRPDDVFATAAAKVSAGRSAGTGARIAHQVHGAIGYTDEHVLRLATTRLWAWRDEFGSDAFWAAELGRQVRTAGSRGLWPLLTEPGRR